MPDILGACLIAAEQAVTGFGVKKSRVIERSYAGFLNRKVVIGSEDGFERFAESPRVS